MPPGGHFRNCYPDTLSFFQVTAAHLKIHLQVPNLTMSGSHIKIGHQEISPSNDNQGNMSHWLHKVHVLTIQMGVS